MGLFVASFFVFSIFMWNHYGSNMDFIAGENVSESIEDQEEDSQLPKYVVQYLYTKCRHHQIKKTDKMPEKLDETVLSEARRIPSHYALPEGWHFTQKQNENGTYFLTKVKKICSDCSQYSYLGVYDENIAVFKGVPPDGVLIEVLDYEVKDVYKEELKNGIPFENEKEKNQILESLTS